VANLQRIKEASDAAAFGSFASDVVLAIDRVRLGHPRSADSAVLNRAADLLDSLSADNGIPDPARRAYSITARQTAQSAARRAFGTTAADVAEVIDPLAVASRALAENQRNVDPKHVDRLIKLFSLIADLQLARGTSIRMHRSTRSPWTATQPT
jgi:hypothetical protein